MRKTSTPRQPSRTCPDSATAGTGAVEFVITAPLILVILFGGVEVARLFFSYHKADHALRAATRFLARVPCENLADRLDEARNLALRGTIDASGDLLLPGWTDPASITLSSDCAPVIQTVTLTAAVTLPFRFMPLFGETAQQTFTVTHSERVIGQ